MDLTDTQRTVLAGVLRRAANDFEFRQELLAAPERVLADETEIEFSGGAGFQVAYASDADFTFVLSAPAGAADTPSVCIIRDDVYPDEDDWLGELAELEPFVPALAERTVTDPAFRAQAVDDPAAAVQALTGVQVSHRLQIVDPARVDFTLIVPSRRAGETPGRVACLPAFQGQDFDADEPGGVDVLTLLASGELSDEDLDAVAGGTGQQGKGQPQGKQPASPFGPFGL